MNVRDYPPYRQGIRNRDSDDNFLESYDDYGAFEDQRVRHDFVLAVYILLCLQLLFTFGFILTCSLVLVKNAVRKIYIEHQQF